MNFIEWIFKDELSNQMMLLKYAFDKGQAAERERIKGRVKQAAENLWCIRNQVGDEPYALYIGPSMTMMEQFVELLLEK